MKDSQAPKTKALALAYPIILLVLSILVITAYGIFLRVEGGFHELLTQIPGNNLEFVAKINKPSEVNSDITEKLTEFVGKKIPQDIEEKILNTDSLIAIYSNGWLAAVKDDFEMQDPSIHITDVKGSYKIIGSFPYENPKESILQIPKLKKFTSNRKIYDMWFYMSFTVNGDSNEKRILSSVFESWSGEVVTGDEKTHLESRLVINKKMISKINTDKKSVNANYVSFQDARYPVTIRLEGSNTYLNTILTEFESITPSVQYEVSKMTDTLQQKSVLGFLSKKNLSKMTEDNMQLLFNLEKNESTLVVPFNQSFMDELLTEMKIKTRMENGTTNQIRLPDNTIAKEKVAHGSAETRQESIKGYDVYVITANSGIFSPILATNEELMIISASYAEFMNFLDNAKVTQTKKTNSLITASIDMSKISDSESEFTNKLKKTFSNAEIMIKKLGNELTLNITAK